MKEAKSANELTVQVMESLIRDYGCFVWRQNTGGIIDRKSGRWRGGSKTGIYDIIGCICKGGRMIAIEIKHGRDSESLDQLAFRNELLAHGAIAGVVRKFDDLAPLLASFGIYKLKK